MLLMRWLPPLLLTLLASVACATLTPTPSPGPGGPTATVATSTPTPVPLAAPARPPILTEAQAKELGTHFAAGGGPELAPSQSVHNPKARLMTLGEYEGRFMQGSSARDGSRPVWVVAVEGEWRDAGIVPPEHRRTYRYGVAVLDAHTGTYLSGSHRLEPVQLEEAEGLDPAAFPTYPLEAPLSYAREAVRFPVPEPASPPQGFTLGRVVLDFINPLPEAPFPPWLAWQAVILRYADQGGKTFDLVHYHGGLPDDLEGAERVTVQGVAGWKQDVPGGPTWLVWEVSYPDVASPFPGATVSVVHLLRSEDGSVSADVLSQVAESLKTPSPASTPGPTSTPVPPVTPYLTPTLTPTPTPRPPGQAVSCAPGATTPPCGPGAQVGRPYAFQLYTHCGIRDAYFDGRWWVASPPLNDGSGNPPAGWGNPFDTGAMVLAAPDLARFTNGRGHVAEFRPAPPSYQPQICF